MTTIDRTRLKSLTEREQKRFVDERPKSKSIFERGKKSLLSGVPMNWMVKWAGAFHPLSAKRRARISMTSTAIAMWTSASATPAP
jgi:hypothetical protein